VLHSSENPPINRPQWVAAISRLLGLKGQPQFQLGRTLGLDLAYNVTDIPYFKGYGVQLGAYYAQAAGGVGIFNYQWAVPTPAVILQIKRIRIVNNAGAAQEYFVGWLPNADLSTIAPDADQAMPILSSGIANERFADARQRAGAHNAQLMTNIIDAVRIPAGESAVLDYFGTGLVMDGSEAGGGIAVANITANQTLWTTWYGQAWPVGG
jgi:hypothetical protein